MERVIVAKNLKKLAGDLRVSGDLADAMDLKVKEILETAANRTVANGRKTILPADL